MKARKTTLIVGGIAVLAIATACNAGGDSDTESAGMTTQTTATTAPAEAAPAEEKQEGHIITFQAETSDGSTGSVTYLDGEMNTVQHSQQPMPWSVDLAPVSSKWDALGANMSVQQQGSGDVTCRVLWDGEVVNESTSSGPYSIASCSLPSDL